jgi:23S rRNA (uracil747-C5)-methyltransferase
MTNNFSCIAYSEKRCASCSSLANPEELYLKKFLTLKNSLETKFPKSSYLQPELLRNPFKSRAKAKLQIGGNVKNPQVGLDKRDGNKFVISPLLDCPLHTPAINPILVTIQSLIAKHGLTPYSIEEKTGELKGVILLETDSGINVRFVSKSTQLKKTFISAAKELVAIHPNIKSVSLNIQPIAHQIVEGDEEHLLLGEKWLKQNYGDFFILLPSLSFVQVTPEIATKLYQTARSWLSNQSDRKILDLFCGAGGFLLSLAPLCKEGLGIELRPDSVECANQSAALQGFSQLKFSQGDLSLLKISDGFDTVVVNPPRRGLGKELIATLRAMRPKQILYSSCNPETLITDIIELGYSPIKFQAFDMFPLTEHLEVLSLLALGE